MSTKKTAATTSGIRLALLNGSYQSIANFYYLLVRGIYIVVFARLLGVELYGSYVYAQSWYVLAFTIAGWGMNELAIAGYRRHIADRNNDFLAAGLALRLLLSAVLALLVIAAALFFETDAKLRLLIIIYAQGVLVRGATNWFQILFVSRESSQYWLCIMVPSLTLEVLAAIGLAAQGAGLTAIAITQCAVWWLTLIIAWYVYRRSFEMIWPRFDWRYTRFYLGNGASLVVAAFILSFLGSGLLIVYRQFADNAQQLGQAAFVIQLLIVCAQVIEAVSTSALPQLNRPGENRPRRQAFYAATIWKQSFYLGGVVFMLCKLLLPPLVVYTMGDEFAGAATNFASFSWLLIPMFIIYGFRLLLISNNQLYGLLMAMLLGLLLMLAQIVVLARSEAVSVSHFLTALGVSYCTIAGAILLVAQRSSLLLSGAELLVAPLLLLACLVIYFAQGGNSSSWGMLAAMLPLTIASVLEIRYSYRKVVGQ